jgi:putative phosphoesterase
VAALTEVFRDVDVILHAGDITHLSLLEDLSAIAPVEAVCGNMDTEAARRLLPAKKVFSIEGISLGLIHGWGPPWGIRQRIRDSFEGVQVVVHGHTHQPFAGFEEAVYFFNPGSAKHSRMPGRGATCGILTVGDTVSGEIVDLRL